MPLLVRFIVMAAMLLVEPIISKIIGALGIGFVTFTGINLLIGKFEQSILTSISGVPADLYAIISISGIGSAFSIILSAFAMRATLAGMDSAGNMVSMRWGKKYD